jgi:glycosyltransferase involved in cell wall biosynthesis
MGPAPSQADGVSYAATQLLRGLADTGAEVDCFVAADAGTLPTELTSHPRLRFFAEQPRRIESRRLRHEPLSRFVIAQLARAEAQSRLAEKVALMHAERPYAALLQFSQLELGRLRRLARRLPPIVLHPEVHAAGELRWLRREAHMWRRCEPAARRVAVHAMLAARSRAQRSSTSRVAGVIAPSRHFADHLGQDYDIAAQRLQVVPNPIDLARFTPASGRGAQPGRPLRLIFVSRIAVRKGVEMVTELSRRLDDLSGRVVIEIVGDRTLWCNYKPLLADLNPATAVYRGPAEPTEVGSLYREADAMIHPAHYEPFGLTVGEGLASGLPVVASDEVGAAEDVDRRCCRIFPAGDAAALEAAVRDLVDELERGGGPSLARLARAEAERLFAPDVVARRLHDAVEELAVHGAPAGMPSFETRVPVSA